jgi:hypothetical protein
MDLIQDLLDGKEWNSDTLDHVANAVRATGRCIDDLEQGTLPDDPDPDHDLRDWRKPAGHAFQAGL